MYYCEDNPASVTLHHTDERACLNSESTHYHLWAVSYQEDYLYLDFYHGILDGVGIYRLLATLLYYYCAARYGISDHRGILTLEDPIRPEETTDPFDELTAAGSAPLHASKPVPAFLITQDGGLKRAQQALVWDIELPEEEFVRFFTAGDGSPTTLVTILLARTLDKIFSDRKKEIVGSCMMNLRPMLKSETHHNCLGVIPFVFSDRVRRMPLDRQCTVHRGTTFVQSDADRVQNAAAAYADLIRKTMQGAPTLEEKKQVFQNLVDGEQKFTYLVSYVGRWSLPSLTPFIRSFYTHCPVFDDLLVQITAVNGKFFLSFHQSFQEDWVIRGFLKRLEDAGIHYKVRAPIPTDSPQFPEPLMDDGQFHK